MSFDASVSLDEMISIIQVQGDEQTVPKLEGLTNSLVS